jgi:beta-lactam-binding protein with PASTA domain
MKIKLFLTSLAIIVSGLTIGQVRPIRAKVAVSNPEIKAFYDAAISVNNEKGRVLNELKKKEKSAKTAVAKRHYSWADIVLKRGYSLTDEIKKTKGNISTTQYADFQRKLQDIETELDKIAGSGTSASGNPAPGTLGECWKSCNDAVGPGFGKGKGFDRFTCKAGCIITKLPPGS